MIRRMIALSRGYVLSCPLEGAAPCRRGIVVSAMLIAVNVIVSIVVVLVTAIVVTVIIVIVILIL